MLLAAFPVSAHHSNAPHFDSSKPVALEGVVTQFRFVNPHAYVYLDVSDAEGSVVNWNCEMRGASVLRRLGWTEDLLRPGTVLAIEGSAARRDPHGCSFTAGVLEDGTRLARSGVISSSEEPEATAAESNAPMTGEPSTMAGLWMSAPRVGGPPRGGGPDRFETLLTEAGKAVNSSYDMRYDDPALFCSPSSIQRAWGEPDSVSEITQTDEEIIIRHEYMDTVRVIDLSTREHPENMEPSLTGHSVGWFEDSTLVIETMGFAAGVLMPHPGILHSEDMRVVERLTLSDDGSQLVREYEIADAQFLKAPLTGTSRWVRTDVPLGSYDCTELSGINNQRPEDSQ